METKKKFWLVLATTVLGMAVLACSCGPLNSLIATPTSEPVVTNPPPSTATRVPPTATHPPEDTLPPATEPPATQPPAYSTAPYSDDFNNSNSGWPVDDTSDYMLAYNTSGFYEMSVKQPKYYVVALAPDHFARPIKDVILHVRAQPSQMNQGDYGIICRYQDIDNFYMAGINGQQFYIGKQVAGEWTYLTDPKWQDIPSLTPDAYGYNLIDMSCFDQFIVLQINGIGAAHVTDPTFSDGDAGLIMWSYDTPDSTGTYARAAFDDFSMELYTP
jgi:hypothetical protein